jgi:hypothetical protein
MKTTISHASQFRDAFRQVDRDGQFSYEALNMLYEYFEDIDPDMELDVIAICCEYSEDTPAELIRDYSIDVSEADPEDERTYKDIVRDYLNDNTTLVGETATGFIYLSF